MKSLAVCLSLLVLWSVSPAKDETQVADLLQKHLASIGTDQAREAIKTRVAEGTLKFQRVNGSGAQDGKEVFVSEGEKMVSLLKLPNPNYHGERFVSDGKKTLIAQLRPGIWSSLGQFVNVHNEILTEGLWGGTLSTGWALAHVDEHRAKLKYEGLKEVNGRELHKVLYLPSKHSDLDIELYFEPGTFRHVMTVYSLTISPQMGRTEEQTARQQETRYRLEERFADFKTVDNLNLPESWIIQFTTENSTTGSTGGGSIATAGGEAGAASTQVSTRGIGTGSSPVLQFEVATTSFSHNQNLDPKNFEIK